VIDQELIIESASPPRSVVKVDWRKPFETENINRFELELDGSASCSVELGPLAR
jgi:hypothetical protein